MRSTTIGTSRNMAAASEPLAVIGFALKFPAGIVDSESLWRVVVNGESGLAAVPEDRLNLENFRNMSFGDDVKPKGYFIDGNIAVFDAPFFSITAEEAKAMDPQQRLLLETAYHAIENAGITLDWLRGSNTSVHVGCLSQDYKLSNAKDPEVAAKYSATGDELSILANRLSWFFNLKGPSLAVETACSSSLVAVDLACQLLRSGDTDMGIIAGTSLIHGPDFYLNLGNMGFLSPDNRCYSFDARANGYSRAEGFGVLLVQRVSDAIKQNRTIRAVIRSSGSNSDGYTPGLTQPNGDAQLALIRETYRKAGLSMKETRYVEAHGTGTMVGDPIEAHAIGAAFRAVRSQDDPLHIGAIKASIGHMEAASGIGGVIKTILVLERGIIPPIADLQELNPTIDHEYYRLKFPVKPTFWPTKGIRRASVNSFGFGGSNAHVVLDDARSFLADNKLTANHNTQSQSLMTSDYHPTSGPNGVVEKSQQTQGFLATCSRSQPHILLFSAADEEGVQRMGQLYGDHCRKLVPGSESIDGICNRLSHTLSCHRTSLPWRSYAIVDSSQSLSSIGKILSIPRRPFTTPVLAFVFTGQGAQWPRMGIELMAYPTFYQSIRRSGKYLMALGCSWDIEEELRAEAVESRVHNPDISQPLCAALQIALVDLLDAIGVKPAIVFGHSSGETAAAYCKGALSHKSAMKIAYFRGLAAAAVARDPETRNGAMLIAGISKMEMLPILKTLAEKGHSDIYIACVNSPTNLTMAGDKNDLGALKLILDEKPAFTRLLKVPCAYHSPHMITSSKAYLSKAGKLDSRREKSDSIPFISYLDGKDTPSDRLQQIDYWLENFCSPVNFTESLSMIDRLASMANGPKKLDLSHRKGLSITNILEIGPHGALRSVIREILQTFQFANNIHYDAAVTRGASALETFLKAVGSLQCCGFNINTSKLSSSYGSEVPPLVDLPAYPFAHSRTFWSESRRSKNQRLRRYKPHELLGVPVPDNNPFFASWRNFLSRSKSTWIEDHNINNIVLYPGAGMLAMAIEAANQHINSILNVEPEAFCMKDVEFMAAMRIPEAPSELETHIYLRVCGEKKIKPSTWYEFNILSCEDGTWKTNCKGLIRAETGNDDSRSLRRPSNDPSSLRNLPPNEFYDSIRKAGYIYGPSFQRISRIQCSAQGDALGTVKVYESSTCKAENRGPRALDMAHIIHPATLDAFLHFPLANIVQDSTDSFPTMIPTKLKRFWLLSTGLDHRTTSTLSVTTKCDLSGYRGYEYSVSVAGPRNETRAEISGYEMTRVSGVAQSSLHTIFPDGIHTCWRPGWEALRTAPTEKPTASQDKKPKEGLRINTVEIHVHSATRSVLELASTLLSRLDASGQWWCKIVDSVHASNLKNSADIKIILWDMDRESILANITKKDLSTLQKILSTKDSILWIQTADQLDPAFSSQHLIDGLSRVVRLEHSMSNFATLSTMSKNTLARTNAIVRVCQTLLSGADSCNIPQTFRETSAGDIEFCSLVEATEITKTVQAARLAPEPEPIPWDVKTPLKMVVGSPGVLDTTHFIEDHEHKDPLQDDEIEVEVKAVGVNFKDCLIALGALNENSIGSEISGVVTRIGRNTISHELRPGSRVFGFSTNGYRTLFRNHAESFSRIPESLTFAEAASIPINYATAWHSLRYMANLVAGETVLIHSGAGGTGQAAIQIAQHLGATVFTTVGTDEKRKLLTAQYGISPNHIFNSRDSTGFSKAVMRLTSGRGVDVVFNSLSGDMLFNSWDCIAPFGRFIEIGKRDIQARNALPMAQFEKNCSFSAVDLGHMFLERPKQVTKLINEIVDLFNGGSLQTVFPIHSFGISNLIASFRLMQGGKSSGKIVVETEPFSHVQAILPTRKKSSFQHNASYIIAGGLGGLGRDIARWMVENGARNLILLSRSGRKTDSALALLSEFMAMGVNCLTPSCDIADKQSLILALESAAESMPPIKGCIQASMVLRPNLFADMNHKDWTETLASKVSGSWNLHHMLPKDLDFFVLLSSVQGIIGSRTQSNYAAANTYLDALAQHRVSHGWKAVSLQLGLMDTDGYLAEHDDEKQMMLAQQTYIPVLRSDFHALLDHYCNADLVLTAPGSEQLTVGLKLLNVDPELDPLGTSWGKNPMFQALRRISADAAGSAGMDVASRFAAANSNTEAVGIVVATLTERLASTIAGTSPQDIEEGKSIQAYGVDSLQTMELRSWFLKSFQSDLPAFEILGAPSLTALARIIVERSQVHKFQATALHHKTSGN